MSYKLLHEADTPEQQIAAKYDVPTFDDYKLGGRETVRDLTEFQDLVFTLVYAIHCGGDKPRCLIINRSKALDLLDELGKIPKEIEGVPIVFDETTLPRISWLA